MKPHCPHSVNRSRTPHPIQFDTFCCHCGAAGWERVEQVADPDHGVFAPPKRETKIDWEKYGDECPGTPPRPKK